MQRPMLIFAMLSSALSLACPWPASGQRISALDPAVQFGRLRGIVAVLGLVRGPSTNQSLWHASFDEVGANGRRRVRDKLPNLCATLQALSPAIHANEVLARGALRDDYSVSDPVLHVEGVIADGHALGSAPDLTVPPLTKSLRIDFTTLPPGLAQDARFEYRLSGVDTAWQNAGSQRSAYYMNLRPGTYVFSLRAYHDNGRPYAPTAISLRMASAWHETFGFHLAVALLIASLVWFGHRLRMRTVLTRMRVRHDERERVARDLHDTLLQGFQGLTLRFQAVRRFVHGEQGLEMLDVALKRADAVLTEGREKVSILRDTAERRGFLHTELQTLGHEFARVWGVRFDCAIHRRPRKLNTCAADEIFAIAKEAMSNAFQHAHPHLVTLCVDYGRRELKVVVSDDGAGFNPDQLALGHWGLRGMRGRAAALGADVHIDSHLGRGSRITISLNARAAYWSRRRHA